MSKFRKIIVAGPLVVEAVYPAPNPRDKAETRQGKKKLTSAAQQRMNLKYAWQKLELEIAANFGIGDIYATFTYGEKLPQSRKEANARISAFMRKLRAARKAHGKTLKYIYVTEHRHGDGRWHHHVLINSTGEDYEEIRKLWGMGGVEFHRIQIDREKNYETLAKYFCKEQRDKMGQRLWSGSRTLEKPQRECFRVPDDTPLNVPKGATLLDEVSERTLYGSFRYIKYLDVGWETAFRQKVKRRRKKN